ncbi:MAG: enoyl-CoA hydratase-related protein, partial [Myxococcota bacterium]
DAAEAERIGLANRVFPHDALLPGVRAWAEDVAAHCSPTSLQVMKRQVWTSMTRDLGPAMTEAIELMRESFDRPDFKEGVDSFLEKRAPEFARIGED